MGDHIWVAGTTGSTSGGTVPPDVTSQTARALDTIEAALAEAGASLTEVVAARIYVTDIEQWQAVAEVLRDRLGSARPAMTIVQVARLMLPEHLIEVEAVARSA